jgi:hypothetical protein
VQEDEPVREAYCPATQLAQATVPVEAANWPRAQLVQEVAPAAEYVPTMQLEQVDVEEVET